MPFVPELALFALRLIVLLVGLAQARGAGPAIGWVMLVGLLGVLA